MVRSDFLLIAAVVKTIEDKDIRQQTALNFAHRLKDHLTKGAWSKQNVLARRLTWFINACEPPAAPKLEIIVGETIVAVPIPI